MSSTAKTKDWQITHAHWPKDREKLAIVRESVFVHEQGVPPSMEWDTADDTAIHLLAHTTSGDPIGTARLTQGGQIGRMAVLPAWRGRGIGSALLEQIVDIAADGDYPGVFLNAQHTAVGFYTRQGFVAEGESFMEAGIPHQRMYHPWLLAPWKDRRLGETSPPITLKGPADIRTASAHMANQTKRSLCLFSHNLDPSIYNRNEFIDAVKRTALHSRFSEIRILVQDSARAVGEGHQLVELARRLSSRIEIRRPCADHLNHAEAFLLADDYGYVHQPLATYPEGIAEYHNPLRARRLLEFFNEAWARAAPDPELRRLYL